MGIVVGLQLAQALGYTDSFMRFAPRPPLPASLTAINLPLLVAALSALVLARLWPVLRLTRTSVVAHEQRRARAAQRPFWQRTYLDVLLLIPVYYAYRQLQTKGTLVPAAVQQSQGGLGSQTQTAPQDPLLFLVPALFALTLSLLAVRLFPLLMRLADTLLTLGRRSTLYLAFRQLARQSDQYVSALLLVITALSLGGFVASMAASLDNWLHDQVYYDIGADVFIKQMYNPVALSEARVPADGAWMLPASSYLEVPGVTDAARVGLYPATTQVSSHESLKGTFIGIDRVDVPRVLFFRRDFSPEPLGSLMNRLGLRTDAVLISERLMQVGRFETGDKIPVQIVLADMFDHKVSVNTQFTVAGSFAYLPTFYPIEIAQPIIRPRGGEREELEPIPTIAIVGNLDYLFELVGGPELHDIWLEIEPDADTDAMQAQVGEMKVYIREWREAREELATAFAQPERVGTLGTLTIGFLAAATFAAIGLLIYNYASLQERLFRFSILRALGISRPQVVAQVVVEYAVLMGYGVAIGAAIAVWTARLFIPFFQAADKNVLRPPKMVPIVAWRDIGLICAAFALALILAQTIMLLAALRRGVFQTLRMGDRE
jgi:putative ABC transport system permease protein